MAVVGDRDAVGRGREVHESTVFLPSEKKEEALMISGTKNRLISKRLISKPHKIEKKPYLTTGSGTPSGGSHVISSPDPSTPWVCGEGRARKSSDISANKIRIES